eukprot:3638744-Prymnesium_polylepis.1
MAAAARAAVRAVTMAVAARVAARVVGTAVRVRLAVTAHRTPGCCRPQRLHDRRNQNLNGCTHSGI